MGRGHREPPGEPRPESVLIRPGPGYRLQELDQVGLLLVRQPEVEAAVVVVHNIECAGYRRAVQDL